MPLDNIATPTEPVIPTKEALLEPDTHDTPEPETPGGDNEPTFTEAEQRAMQHGWTPKDQWKGDPAQWRPADWWLDRGEMLKGISSLRSELHQTKQQVAAAFQQGKQIAEAKAKEELATLRAMRREAMQDGDFDKVDKIEDRLDSLKERIREGTVAPVPKVAAAPPPEFGIFEQRNPWYNADNVLHHTADALGYEFLRVNPQATPAQLYSYVEKTMREKFPELEGKPVKGPPSPGSSPNVPKQGSGGGKTNFTSLKAGMNELERGIMKNLVSTGVYPNEEAYLKDYASAPGR